MGVKVCAYLIIFLKQEEHDWLHQSKNGAR